MHTTSTYLAIFAGVHACAAIAWLPLVHTMLCDLDYDIAGLQIVQMTFMR